MPPLRVTQRLLIAREELVPHDVRLIVRTETRSAQPMPAAVKAIVDSDA